MSIQGTSTPAVPTPAVDWNELPPVPEVKSATPPEPIQQESGEPKEKGEEKVEEVETEEAEGGEDEEVESDGEEDSSDEDEEGEGEEDSSSPDKPKEYSGKVKTYKATRSDGEVVEIADDTSIKIKADGRFVKVNFRDLKDHYAATKTSERIIQEAVNEKRKIEQDLESFRTYTKNINQIMGGVRQAVEAKDIFGILENVAYLSNAEPTDFISNMYASFEKFYTDLAQLDDNQKQSFVSNKKLEIEKKRIDRERNTFHAEKEIARVNKQLDEAERVFGVTRDELRDAFNALAQKTGDPNSVTLDKTLGIVIGSRVLDNINNAEKELNLSLPIEDKRKIYEALYAEEAKGESVEYDEYVHILKNLANKSAKQKNDSELSRKVLKKKPVTTPKKEQQAGQTKRISSWDDL